MVFVYALGFATPVRGKGAVPRQGGRECVGESLDRIAARLFVDGPVFVDGEVCLMSLRQKYLKILSGMLPVGAVGVSLALGAASAAADQGPSGSAATAPRQAGVSERLAAIRDAVSDAAIPAAVPKASQAGEQLAWWAWRNGGGGWRNGGGGWRNGGWRNGGWRNFWRNW